MTQTQGDVANKNSQKVKECTGVKKNETCLWPGELSKKIGKALLDTVVKALLKLAPNTKPQSMNLDIIAFINVQFYPQAHLCLIIFPLFLTTPLSR